jgi:hypothetical protein
MTDWHVVIYQKKPLEVIPVEVFREEADAVRFAETYVEVRPHTRVSKRRWRLDDTDLLTYVEIVKY